MLVSFLNGWFAGDAIPLRGNPNRADEKIPDNCIKTGGSIISVLPSPQLWQEQGSFIPNPAMCYFK